MFQSWNYKCYRRIFPDCNVLFRVMVSLVVSSNHLGNFCPPSHRLFLPTSSRHSVSSQSQFRSIHIERSRMLLGHKTAGHERNMMKYSFIVQGEKTCGYIWLRILLNKTRTKNILKIYPKNEDLNLYFQCFSKQKKWILYSSVNNTSF